MPLTQEQRDYISQTYGTSPQGVDSNSEYNAVEDVARLRNLRQQNQTTQEYKQTPEGQSFLQKFGNFSDKTLGTAGRFLFGGLGKTAGGFVGDIKLGMQQLSGNAPAGQESQISKMPIKEKIGAGIQAGLEVLPYTKFGEALFAKAGDLGKFAKAHPTLARYAGYGKVGAIYGGGFGLGGSLQKEDVTPKEVLTDVFKGVVTGSLLSMAIPAVIEGTVRAVKNVSSLYSGIPKDALEQAFREPERVGEAARKYAKGPEQTQEVLDKANESFNQIKQLRQETYQDGLVRLNKEVFVKVPEGTLYVKNPVTGTFEVTKLTRQGVRTFLTKQLGKVNMARLPQTDQDKIAKLAEVVKNWDDITPMGLDTLRARLGNEASQLKTPEAQRFIYSVQDDVRQ